MKNYGWAGHLEPNMMVHSCQDQPTNVPDSVLDHPSIAIDNDNPSQLNFNHKSNTFSL